MPKLELDNVSLLQTKVVYILLSWLMRETGAVVIQIMRLPNGSSQYNVPDDSICLRTSVFTITQTVLGLRSCVIINTELPATLALEDMSFMPN